MKKIMMLLIAAFSINTAICQNTFNAIVKDSTTQEALIGAVAIVKGTTNGTVAGVNGEITILNIPNGMQTILIKFVGYNTFEKTYQFPLDNTAKPILIYLTSTANETEEIIISSTRTSRTIDNTPTRVETIETEELDEKNNMRPANVSMLLHESTGMQVQQTSATSGNASIRIQGLDGKYTQLLKDGYPNFGNFASGLSILEIPPLDLKQVEIIKGPASTLYGGGAIAGVVNFISKTPTETPEYSFLINQSHIGQTNIGGYASAKNGKIGYSVLALYNYQKPYDVDKDDFTELPLASDFTIHPKLYFYITPKATLMLGNSYTQGSRKGGDINVINNKTDSLHTYFELNKTRRNIATAQFHQFFNGKNALTIKTSFSYYQRSITLSNYLFKGDNYNTFVDASYAHNLPNQTIIVGGSIIYDKFLQTDSVVLNKKNYTTQTTGIYAQHTWDITPIIKSEAGIRAEAVNYFNATYKNTEYFLLPRLSLLFKINEKLSSRIGGGMGYKAPTVFTEQTESFQYRSLAPLANVTAERSYGSTADVNYKTPLGDDLFFSINQMFFYTIINNATVLQWDSAKSNYYFTNATKPVISTGWETNIKLIFKEHLKFFAGYTYTDAQAKYLSGNQYLPLLPRHKLNLALVYELEKNLKIGLESYNSGTQYLSNHTTTKSFWEVGAMAEKTFGKVAIFINFENFADVRQSRYKTVVNPPHSNPSFDEIWTHTEGFVVNGGIKVKL
ncbi:MAG: TonB-dependent receptor [Bacteroidetes bacterium]|nr:TonB-dependent receptor [Bacteroidota bacterium]